MLSFEEFNRIYYTLFFFILSIISFDVNAKLYFNPKFLSNNPSLIADLSKFEDGQEFPPGKYLVDIYVNNRFVIKKKVVFKENENSSKISLHPCFSKKDLISFGIITTKLTTNKEKLSCVNFNKIVNKVDYDFSKEKLTLLVPDVFINSQPRGFVDPGLWDDGITAGLLNYNYSGSSSFGGSSNKNDTSNYLNIGYGINYKDWRLRGTSIISNKGSNIDWSSVNSYLEHDVKKIKGRVRIGDIYTKGDIFDSNNLTGIGVSSVKDMLPDSRRGYAPVIRGVANSTAEVTIIQNGYKIYQKTVPQGPFKIDDLNSYSSGNDLKVIIKESDGTKRVMNVPFSSLPILEREGNISYSVNAGRYDNGNNLQRHPNFIEGTLSLGLDNDKTLYGGVQFSENYKSVNIGVGKNFGDLGALSLDATLADATLSNGRNYQGVSMRALYNKVFKESDTTLNLYGYRYSTKGYYTLSESTYKMMNSSSGDNDFDLSHSKKGRSEINISQPFFGSSSLYLNGYTQTYWGTSDKDVQLQFGLNTSIQGIDASFSYNLSKSAWFYDKDQSISLNLSIPLDLWVSDYSDSVWKDSVLSNDMTTDTKGSANYQLGLFGTLLEDRNLSYSFRTGYNSKIHSKNASSGNISFNYQTSYGDANIGYSYSNDSSRLYYGARGGVVIHNKGITLSRPIYSSAILVRAEGASNVYIDNQADIHTDSNGFAVIPYANSYKYNRVSLNVDKLPPNIELDDNVTRVVPSHNSIVVADFKVRKGLKSLFKLKFNGHYLPFGSNVHLIGSDINGMVSDHGAVYLVGLPAKGELIANWGNGSRCKVRYIISDENKLINSKTLECVSF
ncbi:fimbria/pilus outer membrane usher protein [Photobacterium damselae]|uniref:fimbria/pilus outer membrane usher protein n=1 Tax=Photobacterium damselae TaxID=38293 RepID=UPI0040684902